MKTWYLTKENELQLQFGQLRLVEDLEALRVRIDAALQIVKGELDDPNLGVDYFGIIFSNTPVAMKVQEICRVILQQEGVENVEFNSAEFDHEKQVFTFKFTIYSIYGDFEYDRIFDNPA